MGLDADFWTGRRVLVTGHTGFKGAWLSLLLGKLGAEVHGLGLIPHTDPNLFEAAHVSAGIRSTLGDIRDHSIVEHVVKSAQPEIVIHMASVATVQEAFVSPAKAFSTNVMGTVNLMRALVEAEAQPSAILVVTTDKVYRRSSPPKLFVESDPLGGTDPYSASKVGQELVTMAFRSHYFDSARTRVAVARAGNVIGGGDWSAHRLIPDYIRAGQRGQVVELRHPRAVRPWQFVLDVLHGYLLYAQALSMGTSVPEALNFGPRNGAGISVSELISLFGSGSSDWVVATSPVWDEEPHVGLSPALAHKSLGWRPLFDIKSAVDLTATWYSDFAHGADAQELALGQIDRFLDVAS